MTDEVAAFYDEFTIATMARYRMVGNARLDAAINLARPYVRPGSIVADIGCGIGIVTEALAKHEPTARIIGLDLSSNNIRYATRTVRQPNAQFVVSSVSDQFAVLKQLAQGPVDLVCMIDVIEHIPTEDRLRLFMDIGRIASEDAVFIVTYPSPEFQRYRIEHDPGILQIIDNVIEFDDVYREFRSGGWHLESMCYRGVWYKDEYIHLVLRRKVPEVFPSITPPVIQTLATHLKNFALRPYRRYRYG